MDRKLTCFYILLYFSFFLLLTPLGVFNDWVPPAQHTGYYSATLIDSGDDAGYYAYLRSMFFDGDLDFANERKFFHAEGFTQTGYVANNWQMGQAILFFPFFLIGHFLAWLYNLSGGNIALDGFSAPYYLTTAIASGSCMFAGLILLHRLIEKFCSRQAAMVSTASLWLASPLIYFTFIRQRMAHTAEFFMATVLLWAWIENRNKKNWEGPALMGLAAGMLCLVRPINISFLALFFVDQLYLHFKDREGNSKEKLKEFSMRAAIFFSGFFIALLPQIISWNQLNGVPFPARSVGMAGQGIAGFSISSIWEKALRIFFSPQWGLVWSMPLALVGTLGLLLPSKKIEVLRYGLIAYLLSLISIVLLYPEDSVSYGKRHFISALPVFAIGLGLLWDKLGNRKAFKLAAFSGVLLCICMQYIMLVQYKIVLPYNHPEYTWEALSLTGKLLTERTDLLLRSSNWLTFLMADKDWDFNDKLFLIVFPLLQLTAVLGTAFIIAKSGNHLKERLAAFSGIALFIGLSTGVFLSTPSLSKEKIADRFKYRDLMKSGRELMQKGKFSSAFEGFESASLLEPELYQPKLNVGLTLQMDGKYRQAIPWFEKSLELAPDDALTLFNFGNTLSALGDLDRAESKIKKGLTYQPLSRKAHGFLGDLYMRKNEPQKALEKYLTLLSLNPEDGFAHAKLSMVYIVLNNQILGKHHLKKAIDFRGDPGMIKAIQEFYKTQKSN